MKRTCSFRPKENQEKIKNKLAKFRINKHINIFNQKNFNIPKNIFTSFCILYNKLFFTQNIR
jgi:hypothetical protein